MTDIPRPERPRALHNRGISLTLNYYAEADLIKNPSSAIFLGPTTGVVLSADEARKVRDKLTELIDYAEAVVERAKPKEPTTRETVQALPIGSSFSFRTHGGTVWEAGRYTKIGPSAFWYATPGRGGGGRTDTPLVGWIDGYDIKIHYQP